LFCYVYALHVDSPTRIAAATDPAIAGQGLLLSIYYSLSDFCCAEEVISNERRERRFGFFLLIRDPAVSVDGYATPVAIALDLDCSLKFAHLIYHLIL
jgi:hypothetical protein